MHFIKYNVIFHGNLGYKANPTYIELINTDYYIINPQYQSYYQQIQSIRHELSFMNFDRLLSAIQGMMQTYYKRGFKNGYYDAKCLSHIIRFRIMITSLLEGHSFKEAMTLNDIDSLFLKQIKSYEIQYTYQQAFDIAIEEIKKVKEMINKYRSSHDSVINLKAKDDLSYIIENIIKKAIYKDKIK